jgi:hypothetical protein
MSASRVKEAERQHIAGAPCNARLAPRQPRAALAERVGGMLDSRRNRVMEKHVTDHDRGH